MRKHRLTNRFAIYYGIVVLFFYFSGQSFSANLKILTINVWFGLETSGFWQFNYYEQPDRREQRFEILIEQIKELNPDIIYIQEANPISDYMSDLANRLDMEEIHQVCNSGLKIFGFGFPIHLNEGIGILAKKSLNLEQIESIKLNGILGIHSDNFSIHTNQSDFALVGRIIVNNMPVLLINTHLPSSPIINDAIFKKYTKIAKEKGATDKEITQAINLSYTISDIRHKNLDRINDFVNDLPKLTPVIFGGDLNASPDSYEIKQFKDSLFFDSFVSDDKSVTWSAENENVRFSTSEMHNEKDFGYNFLQSLSSEYSEKIDYLFFNKSSFRKNNIISSQIAVNKKLNGMYASDHFGIMTVVNLDTAEKFAPKYSKNLATYDKWNIDPFPILSFDYDIGFGFGAKAILLNTLKKSESFDIAVFGTTKGELWTRFAFSMPNYELRQKKIYPISVDFVFDYEKNPAYSFFGTGNNSLLASKEVLTKEVTQFNLNFTRGETQSLVLNAGFNFMYIRNTNLSDSSKLQLLGGKNTGTISYISILAAIRYDTRNSFINPTKGFVALAEGEYIPNLSFNDVTFGRVAIWLQNYTKLFFPTTVLAARIGLQQLFGSSLPVQVLLPVGGYKNLRGFPLDRYMDNVSAVCNIELRFPIYWRIGAVAGIDAGKVWNRFNKLDLFNWPYNYVIGLRGFMNTFVIRADFGISKETTGIYLNFDHLF